jgi:hypothetical protein
MFRMVYAVSYHWRHLRPLVIREFPRLPRFSERDNDVMMVLRSPAI